MQGRKQPEGLQPLPCHRPDTRPPPSSAQQAGGLNEGEPPTSLLQVPPSPKETHETRREFAKSGSEPSAKPRVPAARQRRSKTKREGGGALQSSCLSLGDKNTQAARGTLSTSERQLSAARGQKAKAPDPRREAPTRTVAQEGHESRRRTDRGTPPPAHGHQRDPPTPQGREGRSPTGPHHAVVPAGRRIPSFTAEVGEGWNLCFSHIRFRPKLCTNLKDRDRRRYRSRPSPPHPRGTMRAKGTSKGLPGSDVRPEGEPLGQAVPQGPVALTAASPSFLSGPATSPSS